MLRCGLLGRTLSHSYSPAIHALLGDYRYDLIELEPEALEAFVKTGPWDGLNVTSPIKKPWCPSATSSLPWQRPWAASTPW